MHTSQPDWSNYDESILQRIDRKLSGPDRQPDLHSGQLPDGTVVSEEPPKETGRQKKGCIRVEATDNIQVVKMVVTILDEENQVVEVGDALRQKGDWWKFATQREGATIRAEAWDLPGHKTRAEFKPSCGYNLGSKENRQPQSAP